MGTVRRRGKGYEIDYYAYGRRIREAVGPNKQEAQEVLGKKLQEIRQRKFQLPPTIQHVRIEELIKTYIERFKGRTLINEKLLLKIVENHFVGKFVAEIAIFDVETFLKVRRDTPTKKKTARTPATCNRELGVLKRLLNKAVAWGMAPYNPALGVKPLPEPKGRTRFLSVEEARKLIECSSRHLRPIILTALETGMRRGELMRLRWADIDLKNRNIFIPYAKNGHSRHVPMSERLRDILRRMPRRLRDTYVFTGKPKIGRPGQPFFDVRTSFENACTRAGIENFRFHDLRHTAASHMVMRGIDLKTVGEILGHKTAAMTERYAHLSPEHKLKAINLLPDWTAKPENRSQTGRKIEGR